MHGLNDFMGLHMVDREWAPEQTLTPVAVILLGKRSGQDRRVAEPFPDD
jgi:hypothetical protein